MTTGFRSIALIIALAGAGCNSAAEEQTPPPAAAQAPQAKPPTTVTIDGKPRTCAELICESPKGCAATASCNENFQRAFDRWGSKIHAYVTSGSLGPLGNDVGTIDKPRAGSRWRYQDVAAAGLSACFIADRGGNDTKFIDYMLESHPREDRLALLPFWFGAQRHLCPDVKFPMLGGDQRIQ